jgi:hypothetical protein
MVAPLINLHQSGQGQPRALGRSQPTARLSKKFHVGVEKLPCSRRGIGAIARKIQTCGNQRGTVMTITEYLAATILVALILWAVLGLLMQESDAN